MASSPHITPSYTIHPVPSSSPTLLPTFLSLFDESIAWLTTKGISAQWGSKALKDDEAHVGKVKGIIQRCEFLLATPIAPFPSPTPLGLLAFSPHRCHPEIIPATSEPELYIHAILTSRTDPRAKGVGRALVVACEAAAIEKEVELLRLDCFDGEESKGGLVGVYEGMGFERVGERIVYDKEGWVGQVMGKRVGGREGSGSDWYRLLG